MSLPLIWLWSALLLSVGRLCRPPAQRSALPSDDLAQHRHEALTVPFHFTSRLCTLTYAFSRQSFYFWASDALRLQPNTCVGGRSPDRATPHLLPRVIYGKGDGFFEDINCRALLYTENELAASSAPRMVDYVSGIKHRRVPSLPDWDACSRCIYIPFARHQKLLFFSFILNHHRN